MHENLNEKHIIGLPLNAKQLAFDLSFLLIGRMKEVNVSMILKLDDTLKVLYRECNIEIRASRF